MQPELTLIVAATRTMGIGLQGGLPWKGLRKEMQYFARVTQRPAPLSNAINAVIMGRKTWDSIPPSFRPLKNRLNIVITRSAPLPPPLAHDPSLAQEIRVPSIEAALRCAQESGASRIFVIGGAAIYRAALEMQSARMRILLTSIEEDFDCDVFFPLDPRTAEGWRRSSVRELGEWTGEDEGAVGGMREEAGVHYEFQMWEKEE
ncbi:Dihydrofolate reductase [Escovopsis weberi]|uniref:Dihydrofolate reductase n=1 Tax=Escovopsis weberi TaxID=150374 RepID=A0A0M9VSP1_ESCWE|nr:Dihydrofolate reductase [Escovopsis weberi]